MVYPAFYEMFGYSTLYFEGDIGKAPPILYKTSQWYGYIRNQFLFERPISYGFFLIAFWPLFYIHILKSKSLKKTRGWRLVYMLNVVITFARSAWGAIFIQIILLGLITYKKHLKKFIFGIIVPMFVALSGIIYIGREQLIHRAASNGGHIKFFLQAVGKV